MSASLYIPSEEFPTYDDYRRAKRKVARKKWRENNREQFRASERARQKAKYANDVEYREMMKRRAIDTYTANSERVKLVVRTYRAVNASKYKVYGEAYRAANKSVAKNYKLTWARKNAARVYDRNAARRALCSQATPGWADRESIRDVYSEARYMQMHVDHIVPLNHPLVCGLHVWENLQLLYQEDNLRKNNKFDPETFNAN